MSPELSQRTKDVLRLTCTREWPSCNFLSSAGVATPTARDISGLARSKAADGNTAPFCSRVSNSALRLDAYEDEFTL